MTLFGIVYRIGDIFALLMPVLISFAMIVFIWGVIKYIIAGDSEEGRTNARNTIVYGVIGLFAIVAVWGLVEIIRVTFGVYETNTSIPQHDFRTPYR